jgi:hypothetical protein
MLYPLSYEGSGGILHEPPGRFVPMAATTIAGLMLDGG